MSTTFVPPGFVSAETQARFEALVEYTAHPDLHQFSQADAGVAEELRRGMLAFIKEPSVQLASKFTSTFETLERLVRTYPPIGVNEFLSRVAGCEISCDDIYPPAEESVYYVFVRECLEVYHVGDARAYNDLTDRRLFDQQMKDPRHSIRPDWNANFQVYVLLGLFKAYVSRFYARLDFSVGVTFEEANDLSYLVEGAPPTCGRYVGFLDPDFYMRRIVSDLVAPEKQVPGCKYAFGYDDVVSYIQCLENETDDMNWAIVHDPDYFFYLCAIIVLPYSNLVPPGYGLQVDHPFLGSLTYAYGV